MRAIRETTLALFIAVVATSYVAAQKHEQKGPTVGSEGLGSLVDMLRENYVNLNHPEKSEVALYMNNAIRLSNYQNVFEKGRKVDAYVVHDKDNFVLGVYPAPPTLMSSRDDPVTFDRITVTGTGEWYKPQEVTIGPRKEFEMKNWDRFVEDAANRGYTEGQLKAYATVIKKLGGQDEHAGDPAVKGVKIYFDDRLLGRALGRLDQPGTVEALEKLGNSLFSASNSGTVEPVLREFINEQKAKLVHVRSAKIEVKGAVLVSLRQVLARIQAAGGDFQSLPDDIRSLAGLSRIHGYVRDDPADDIVLVGTKDPGVEPIGLDNLIVALSAVWKNGAIPSVSLDPDPAHPQGPQHTAVYGVPRNCRFARIMLDADYLMKKISMGYPTERLAIADFPTLKQLLEENDAPLMSRQWLTPIQPGEGDIQLSSEEDVVLFETAVRVQTESMQLVQSNLVGLGASDPRDERIASAFTSHYEEIERERPVFRQLHGLFDLVLLAKIWRQLEVRSGTLDGLASLKVPEIELPQSFAGVTVVLRRSSGRLGELSGGVVVSSRFGSRQQLHYDDVTIEQLRSLAHNLAARKKTTATVNDLVLDLAQPREAAIAFEDGVSALAQKNYRKARDAFTSAIAADGAFGEAYVMRSQARWELGDRDGAQADMDRAIILSPADPDFKIERMVLLLKMGQDPKQTGADEATRSAVANRFYEQAQAMWEEKGQLESALAALDVAIGVSSNHGDAHALRAFLRLRGNDVKNAQGDATEAVRLNPKSAWAREIRGIARFASNDEEGAFDDFSSAIKLDPEAPESYANRARIYEKWGNSKQAEIDMAQYAALEVGLYTRLIADDPNNPALYVQRGMKKRANHMDPQSAIEDFSQAIKMDARFAVAYAMRASARHSKEDYDGALSDSSSAIALDPGYAYAYAVRGAAEYKLKRLDDSIRDCNTAIAKDAKIAYAFHIRALAKSDSRDYDGAIKDWEQAQRLNPEERGLYQQLIDQTRRSK